MEENQQDVHSDQTTTALTVIEKTDFPVSNSNKILTKDDFFYNPFGHGSLLEQAIWFIRDEAYGGEANTLVNMSNMSRMLNEIIEREMALMGIVIEERFVFGSVNEYGAGGYMWVECDGRRYMQWSI
jgi:hypothetical protein